MKEQDLCKKRLIDLSHQASVKEIVLFSPFLNLNEQNIYHTNKNQYYCNTKLFGGYDGAERQMVAFIPDALCYEWEYPIDCIKIAPQYPKFAEEYTHRDVLGALMSLGIERSILGDIVFQEKACYVFVDQMMSSFLMENIHEIKHTIVTTELWVPKELSLKQEYEVKNESIASDRIDCIIAKAYNLSRSQAAELLISERVFCDGKTISNCNHNCKSGSIISVRGKGRFRFETQKDITKKGKLKVQFHYYK